MEELYALIKNGIVENVIVASAEFIAKISAKYDSIVQVDKLPVRPGVGWTFDGDLFDNPIKDLPPESDLERRIKAKQANMIKGARIIGLVSVMNEDKNLTGIQMVQFAQTFSQIQGLLQAGSLNLAKGAIETIVPDGVLVTQVDKDAILAELNKLIAGQFE